MTGPRDFWINGQFTSTLSAQDRGLMYGDGVFETVRVVQGRLTLPELHYQRLQASCEKLSLPCRIPEIKTQVASFLVGRADGVLKIIVTRGVGGRGYNPFGARGSLMLGWYPLPPDLAAKAASGVQVRLCDIRLGHSPALAGIKHLNRLEQVLARSEWSEPQIAEGLVLDLGNNLIEGTMSNLFLVRDGLLLTPGLSRCGVAGVMREWLLAGGRGLPRAEVCELGLDDLYNAREVFLANSVIGIWPVVQCGQHYWQAGPVTRQIQQRVDQLFS